MKQYPSIPTEIQNIFCYCFDKLDGSNIRAEWNPKQGFYKFGTKHHLLNESDPILGKAINLIQSKYDSINSLLRKTKTERAICFFEFWGPTSAFGQHNPNEQQTVTLIDVSLYKKGIIEPKEFLDLFDSVDYAKLLAFGNMNNTFITDVQNGSLPNLGPEGVVCKGPFDRTLGSPIMFKIKRNDWYDRLKLHCNGNNELFEKLK